MQWWYYAHLAVIWSLNFSERFFLLIHLRTFQKANFVRKHLSRQIFDAATLSLGVGESAFATSLSAKRHARTAQRAEGDFSLVVSQCLDTFELLTEFYPTFHHLSFFFQIVPTFLESALEYSGYWKSLWKNWWFQLSGFNQSNPVSEFLLILGLPSLGVEQNWQPLSL